jgi:hypothetical protein
MPGYYFYKTYYSFLAKSFPKADSAWIFAQGLRAANQVQDIVARDILFFEWCWKRRGVIWFLENQDLIDFLIGSKFEKVKLSDIPDTKDPIMLSYPNRFGEKLGGVLVRKLTLGQRRVLLSEFYNVAGMKVTPDQFYSSEPTTQDMATNLLEVAFCRRDERYRYIIPEAKFQEALDGDWWEDPITHKDSRIPIEESDIALQKVHFKLALRALLYASAFPEALHPGLPPKKQRMGYLPCQEDRAFMFKRHVEHRASPCLHLRSAHARVLKDERYKRGPDGQPRVVPVSMAVVAGHEVDPSVLEKLRNDVLSSIR